MFFLRLLGGLSLTTASGPVTGRATQRRRLALLTILATSRGQPVSRDKLLGLLWPAVDGARARHLLSDSLYILREALGDDALILAGGTVALNPDRVTSEVTAFTNALSRGDREAAVEAFSGKGVFLDGLYLSDAPDFERWVETTRAQLTAEYRRVLEQLAAEASTQGRPSDAVLWWRRLALDDHLVVVAFVAPFEWRDQPRPDAPGHQNRDDDDQQVPSVLRVHGCPFNGAAALRSLNKSSALTRHAAMLGKVHSDSGTASPMQRRACGS